MPFGKRRRTLADVLLHFFKDLAGNDGFMVVTNEVLRQFAEVGAVDLAEIPLPRWKNTGRTGAGISISTAIWTRRNRCMITCTLS